MGREITTLVNQEKPVGNYEVEFEEIITGIPIGGKSQLGKMIRNAKS